MEHEWRGYEPIRPRAGWDWRRTLQRVLAPIGAIADSLGGLAAARLLSLACMLGVTSFLWSTARRLLADERAALVDYCLRMQADDLTVGELARFFNAEMKIGCDLEVVPMEGWTRAMWWDDTGLAWVNPSPNIRNPTQAELDRLLTAIKPPEIEEEAE